jgi:hypothetical protein
LDFVIKKYTAEAGRSFILYDGGEFNDWPFFFNFGGQLSLFKNKKFHLP